MTRIVIRAPRIRDVDELRTALEAAFTGMRDGVLAGSPVTFIVPAGDLLGHGSLCDAVYANAVVGMTRAATFEGGRHGWQVNVEGVPGDRQAVAERGEALADLGLQGQVVIFGSQLVGKVIP